MKVRDATVSDAVKIEAVHRASREAAFRGRLPPDVISPLDRPERLERWRTESALATLAGEMPTLYVDPAARRKGYGVDLYRVLEDRAREMGFQELVLWVLEVNSGARRFYDAVGFAHDGVTKIDDGPIPAPLLALRCRKKLTP